MRSVCKWALAAMLALLSVLASAAPAAAAQFYSPFVACDGGPVAVDPADIVVTGVGDLAFSANAADNRTAFTPFMALLNRSDFVFGNLEGAITDYGVSTKTPIPGRVYAFKFPASTAELLRDARFNAISVSNNHSHDYGEPGFSDTRANLARVGIETTGVKGSMVLATVRGKRLALLAFGVYPAFNDIRDLAAVRQLIRRARAQADIVVVTFEGGAEGSPAAFLKDGSDLFLGEDRGDVRAFARTAVAAGADLIIGHGPHVVRAAECVSGRPVFYSLGNFVSNGGLSINGYAGVGAMAQAVFDPSGQLKGVRIIPATLLASRLPFPDRSGRAVQLINWLTDRAASLPGFTPLRLPGYEGDAGAFNQWLGGAR